MLRRPEYKEEPLEFPDPNQEESLKLSFSNRLSAFAKWRAEEIQQKIFRRYVTGNWVDEKGNFIEDPEPMLGLYGEGIINPDDLSQSAIWTAARVEALQKKVTMTAIEFLQHAEYYPIAVVDIEEAVMQRCQVDPKASKLNSGATGSSSDQQLSTD